MDKIELIKEFGFEYSRSNVIRLISEKIDEYRTTRNPEVQKELAKLILDREKIYDLDVDTIQKYLKK